MFGRIYPLAVLLVFADVVVKATCQEKDYTIVISANELMRNVINIIKNNIKYSFSDTDNIVLVTFHDTDARVKKVANIDALRRALDDVYYESTYRRINCLESSMNALITALQASNSNSHILVFANTLPEDSEKVDIVKELCQKKQTQISFVVTEKNCTRYSSINNKNEYSKIAQACSGMVYEVEEDELVKTKANVFHHIGSPRTYTIYDRNIVISATTVPAGVWKNIPVTKYNLDPGKHTLTVKGESETYVVIRSRTHFSFKYGFSELKPASFDDTSPQISSDIDVYFLSVLVNDKDEIVEITTAQILGMDDKPLMPHLPLIKISKDFYVTQPVVAPKDMFKVALHGRVKRTGHNIRRFANFPVTPSKPISKKPRLEKTNDQVPKVVIAEGNETSVEYRTSLTLTCKVTAHPKPTITWHNNNGDKMPSKSPTIDKPPDYISYLEIAEAVNDTYMCRAVNKAGTINAQIKVHAKYPFTINNTVQNLNVEYGKSKVLKCGVKSTLPVKITWFLINQISGRKRKIINSDDFSISEDKTEVTIKKMHMDIVGKYACHVALIPYHKKYIADWSVNVQITGLTNPKVHMPEKVKTVRGVTAVLECNATGVPKPTIEWHFGNKSGSMFEPLGETNAVLRIKNVEAKHEGQYKCVAENKLSKDARVTTLIVQDIPKILSRRSIIYQAFEGDPVLKIPCVAVGKPKPNITWKMDGRPIKAPNAKFEVENGTLIIKFPKVVDTKSYSCVAANEAGSETATFKTIIREAVPEKTTSRSHKSLDKTCSFSSKARVKTTWFAERPNVVCDEKCKNKKPTETTINQCEKK
ncbi:hemicentin-2 isoform X2 [Spodoptera frugiperda]|uniref:Hemicentin-2 isoform X2 n=1 Tax=Spodoptera frugiperda TaxID=7108 RepID=A0A9R0DS33_SPOFR|nr:hemicentin-2 isoform X2 [Spodoptera frugiperda]